MWLGDGITGGDAGSPPEGSLAEGPLAEGSPVDGSLAGGSLSDGSGAGWLWVCTGTGWGCGWLCEGRGTGTCLVGFWAGFGAGWSVCGAEGTLAVGSSEELPDGAEGTTGGRYAGGTTGGWDAVGPDQGMRVQPPVPVEGLTELPGPPWVDVVVGDEESTPRAELMAVEPLPALTGAPCGVVCGGRNHVVGAGPWVCA